MGASEGMIFTRKALVVKSRLQDRRSLRDLSGPNVALDLIANRAV